MNKVLVFLGCMMTQVIMPHMWMQTLEMDQDLAKQLIEEQTVLHVDAITQLGQGFDNVAYYVNEQYVFRFPRKQESISFMNSEIAVLSKLAQKISFPCSSPIFIGHATEKYQAPFVGYKMLLGTSICDMPIPIVDDPQFAITLAEWLQELHGVPVAVEDRQFIFESFNWKYNFHERLDRAVVRLNEYKAYFTDLGFHKDQLLAIIAKLKILSEKLHHIKRNVYCHGDLHSKHMLVDKAYQLTGLIDWGDLHIGNPGIDLFAGYLVLSDDALQLFLTTYGNVTQEMSLVAMIHMVCVSIPVIAYCCDTRTEENLKQSAIFGLRRALKIVDAW